MPYKSLPDGYFLHELKYNTEDWWWEGKSGTDDQGEYIYDTANDLSAFKQFHKQGWTGKGFALRAPSHQGYYWFEDVTINVAPNMEVTKTSWDPHFNANKSVRLRNHYKFAQYTDFISIDRNGTDETNYCSTYTGDKNCATIHGVTTGIIHETLDNAIVAAATSVVWHKYNTLNANQIATIITSTADDDGTFNIAKAMSPNGVLD